MNPLIASIISNPSAHQVNRAEKMDKTLEVMANNLVKKEQRISNGHAIADSDNRGYGKNKNMGD